MTNHQLLTIKTIKKWFPVVCVLGHIALGFISFNKPQIEGDQLPVKPLQILWWYLLYLQTMKLLNNKRPLSEKGTKIVIELMPFQKKYLIYA